MKNVRLIFTKKGRARFVSHLDMNRLMIRLVRKAGLDIWYTEGFNPHPYITFALPLPLGFEGNYEIMDIRVTDDNYDISVIPKKLNNVCPEFIRFVSAIEPQKKVGEIAYGAYEIVFDDNGGIKEALEAFLSKPSIMVQKKTKRGELKEIDIAEKIKSYSILNNSGDTLFTVILPAGSNDNLNPTLLLDAFFAENSDKKCFYDVTRTDILDASLNRFL